MSTLRRLYLTAFFAFGTTFWYEAAKGDTWAMPSVVGTLFTLLTLNEIFGRRRGWLVGLWAGCAALGQYQYAFVIPVYAWMMWRD